MRLLILAAVLALSAGIVQKKNVIINNINYEQETFIKFHETYRHNMLSISIDNKNNVLYYTYYDTGKTGFISNAVNLETKESYNMPGYGTIVDPKTHKIYIQKYDGIYEFDHQTQVVRDLMKTDLDIWKVFAKDGVYFTTFDETAYVYKNGNVEKVSEIGDMKAISIAVDKDDNIFFSNSSGLFFHKKGGEQTTFVDRNVVYSFSMDSNEKLYFTTYDGSGIYSTQVTNGNVIITKLTNDCCTSISEMAIKSDGSFFYSDSTNEIVTLKPREECAGLKHNDFMCFWRSCFCI